LKIIIIYNDNFSLAFKLKLNTECKIHTVHPHFISAAL